jgi:hypothetical protein
MKRCRLVIVNTGALASLGILLFACQGQRRPLVVPTAKPDGESRPSIRFPAGVRPDSGSYCAGHLGPGYARAVRSLREGLGYCGFIVGVGGWGVVHTARRIRTTYWVKNLVLRPRKQLPRPMALNRWDDVFSVYAVVSRRGQHCYLEAVSCSKTPASVEEIVGSLSYFGKHRKLNDVLAYQYPRRAAALLVEELNVFDPEMGVKLVRARHVCKAICGLESITGTSFKFAPTGKISAGMFAYRKGRPGPYCGERMSTARFFLAPLDIQKKVVAAWRKWARIELPRFVPPLHHTYSCL